MSRFIACVLIALLAGCAQKGGGPASGTSVPLRYEKGSTQFTEEFKQSFSATVHFTLDGTSIKAQDASELDKIAAQMQKHSSLRVYVDGFTCELGGDEYNIALGYRRAQAVSDYLVKQGASPDQIILLSYGKEKPVDERHVEEAWRKNRRVEVSLMQPLA